jgi:hypothetical protein
MEAVNRAMRDLQVIDNRSFNSAANETR